MFKSTLMLLIALLCKATLATCQLPVIDLGYERHQALAYNNLTDTYTFSNIRYAQPPVGPLRFAAPVPPTGQNPTIQDGSKPVVCPQAVPKWFSMGNLFAQAFEAGDYTSFNYEAAKPAAAILDAQLTEQYSTIPGTSEDCLFLDIYVPASVMNGAKNAKKQAVRAPVVVWIHGGGYVAGAKSVAGEPYGLIRASQKNGQPGIIFVQINYRLGALGWLAGSTLQDSGAVPNAGLYDQRLALEWVQQHTALFGGDPSRVTVMGESAGGGSVLHHLTAYGGERPVPFQQAILQSAGFWPLPDSLVQDNTTYQFLSHLNVNTIEEARQVSSNAVIEANLALVAAQPEGVLNLGPAVDGNFVPSPPGISFLNGAYAKDVTVMLGHNTNEGPAFTPPPYTGSDEDISEFFRSNYPSISEESLDHIIDTLYPAVYDGSQPYSTPTDRSILITSDRIFTCNVQYVTAAYGNRTHNYEFEVPPALHGYDLYYTFFNSQGPPTPIPVSSDLATKMQQYFANFITGGDPNGAGLPELPIQGDGTLQVGFNVTKNSKSVITLQHDPTVNCRCKWWQNAAFSGPRN